MGYSDIARRKFIPAIQQSNRVQLKSIASIKLAKGSFSATNTEVTSISYDKLISHPDIDLVYISLPNHLHEEWSIRALKAGKHVICEKPLGLTSSSVMHMLECADKAELLLYENLMFIHHPQHNFVQQIIASRKLGAIKSLRCVYGFPFPDAGNFRLDKESGGGAFHDLIRYPLGTALYFLRGEFNHFQGISIAANGLNTGMHAMSYTSSGELFSFSIAFGQQYESFYEVVAEHGKIKVDRAYTPPPELENLIRLNCGNQFEILTVPAYDQFKLMVEHVCELIRYGRGFSTEHERSRKLAILSEAAEKDCLHEEQKR